MVLRDNGSQKIDIETSVEREGHVTLVSATVHNPMGTLQEVTMEPAVDGPVWLPRTEGVTAPEWDSGTWSAILRSGETRGLGFATSATSDDPSVEVVSAERVIKIDDDRDPEEVLVSLDDWRPPLCAVCDP